MWRADLEAVSDDLSELMCREECARAERFPHERDRKLWTRSRGVLRALLERYLHVDARTLHFGAGAHGKPVLIDDASGSRAAAESTPASSTRISFNLSHSDKLALYAFTSTAAIGVDVELARRASNVLAVAARTFGSAEAQRLEKLDAATRELEFRRAWVRYEAELKCLGVGIGGADTDVERPRPWIAQLEMGPSAAAAVAVEVRPRELRCWDWRG